MWEEVELKRWHRSGKRWRGRDGIGGRKGGGEEMA